jgi:diaminopimelate decarboxylase
MNKLTFERPFIKKIKAGVPSKFGMNTGIEAITHIDGVSVIQLIEKYGSPLFVISEKTIRNTYREAKRAFTTRYPRVQFAWSYKTNYLNAVCQVFHQEGAWAEVVSGFEYDKALNNGISGKHIIFNGPEKSEEELIKAINLGSLIHIDHFDELFTLIELSERMNEVPKVAIRVNMDTGVYPIWDRFGFSYENGEAWDALNRIMLSKKMNLVGLHTHIGTYMLSHDAYRIAAAKLADLVVGLDKKYNHSIQYIDMGGGFASKNTLKGAYYSGSDTAPSFNDYAEAISSAIINSQIHPDKLPLLILETGRALIDDAGYLLSTVVANKRLSDGRRATIMDAGVNILFTSFWYDHQIHPAQAMSLNTEETSIYGPLCMNIDVIRDAAIMPLYRKGDKVVIKRVGAYNMTQWMQFIHMRPGIIMIDLDGNTHMIRDRETIQTLNQLEHTPAHLRQSIVQES